MLQIKPVYYAFIVWLSFQKNQCEKNLKRLLSPHERIEWMVVFLRDIGVAVIAGAILGGVVNGLQWWGAIFLLSAALTCVILVLA
jgi:hypothetical protein